MPKTPTKTHIHKKKMLVALEKSLGVVTTACKNVGIDRSRHYEWLKSDEDYKVAVKSIEDIAIDFAESQLHKQIGNGQTVATIFFLKTKAKHRGYVERQEIDLDVDGRMNLTVQFVE
jgi:hypothetical protein